MRINVYQVTFHTITYADKNQNGIPVEVSRTEPATEKVGARTPQEAFALISAPAGEGLELVHLSTRTLQQHILVADDGGPLTDAAPPEEPVEQADAEEPEPEGEPKKEGIWERLTS